MKCSMRGVIFLYIHWTPMKDLHYFILTTITSCRPRCHNGLQTIDSKLSSKVMKAKTRIPCTPERVL